MTAQICVYKIEDLASMVRQHFLPLMQPGTIFAFSGPLGAGKTTLIRELLMQCSVDEPVTSPTFTYVQTYHGKNGLIFHHFDAYRISSAAAFMHYGFDEYLKQSDAICLIEWPEVLSGLFDNEFVGKMIWKVQVSYIKQDMNARCFALSRA